MKIVVLGASGYLAGHVTRQLIAQDHELFEYHRRVPASPSIGAVRVLRSATDIPAAISEDRPNVVINMANLYTREADIDTVARLVEVNSLLMSVAAEACLQVGARLLHVGSAWQADLSAGSLGLDEAPIYSLHRGIASSIGRWYRIHRGLDFAELAVADTYGPDDPRGKLITQMLASAQTGATEFALGSQDPTLYPVHVDDVARCVAKAVEAPLPGLQEPWLCAWQPGISVSQLVTIINDLYGLAMAPKFGSRSARPKLNLSGFSRLPDWEPGISPQEGLLLLGER